MSKRGGGEQPESRPVNHGSEGWAALGYERQRVIHYWKPSDTRYLHTLCGRMEPRTCVLFDSRTYKPHCKRCEKNLMTQLNATLQRCVDYMKANGKLHRHKGGYWAHRLWAPGEPSFGTATVLALIARRVVKVTDWQRNSRGVNIESEVELTS